MKSKHKIIDLFSGAGGFSLGFEMAGFETVLAIDYWEDAVRTFNHNRKKKVAIHFDIKKFDKKKINEFLKDNEITGIIGGPPCQGFSMVGTRRTDDIRNDLYLEYCRFGKMMSSKNLRF
jgi:DNA (cytosine-5)-methyltransferase 1